MITATYKGKRYEVEYSVVNVSELEGALRLDAEYYEPYFLRYEALVRRKQYCKIGDFVNKVQYGLSLAINEDGVGYKILKMDDIIGILADDSNCKYIDIDEKTFEMYRLKKGDILFNRVNSEEFVGRTGIYLLDGLHTFASYLIRMKAKEYFTNFYIAVYLNTEYGRVSLKRVMRRAVNQANINAEEIKSLTIPILSDTFQKQIQNLVLQSYDEKEKSVSLYKKAEDTLLEELDLKDWKPKTKKIFVGGKEYEEEENISIRNLSEVLKADRMDAEYWEPKYEEIITKLNGKIELKPLKKFILSIQKGVEVGSDNYVEEGKPFIRVSNLSINGFMNNDQKYINDEIYNQLKATYEPEVGDLLLTKDATPGIAYVLKDSIKGIISSGILKLKINENEIEKEYLALCINSLFGKMQVERDGGGSVITHWKPEQIKNLQIPLLPLPIQQKIASLVQQSHEVRKKSKELLEIAKRAVEIAIEENENKAMKHISTNNNSKEE
ncbi:MAG: restriction endonuclease subunit S [Caldisericum sp.]|jgi:restriction endonuclease S subunit|nr:restriction endonuclease subunit S [Caldisericum sp.]